MRDYWFIVVLLTQGWLTSVVEGEEESTTLSAVYFVQLVQISESITINPYFSISNSVVFACK